MTSKSQSTLIAAISLTAVLFCSCANTTEPSTAEKLLAMNFQPPKGKALLYVYRPSSVLRHEAKHVVINQRSIGITGSGTFLVTTLSPANYNISAGGDPIELSVSANRLYFIRQSPEKKYLGSSVSLVTPVPMLMPAPSLVFASSMVSEWEGRQGIANCIQVATGSF